MRNAEFCWRTNLNKSVLSWHIVSVYFQNVNSHLLKHLRARIDQTQRSFQLMEITKQVKSNYWDSNYRGRRATRGPNRLI